LNGNYTLFIFFAFGNIENKTNPNHMKIFYLLVILFCSILKISAEDKDFETIIENNITGEKIKILYKIPTTPVKDQYKTNTCWSFSGISLLESELIRMGKGEFNLSEMYIVRLNYERKAIRYIRMHGKTNFAPGGETNDVTDVIDRFGIVPEEVYTGLKVNAEHHVHSEMDRVLQKYLDALLSDPQKELSPVWKEGFNCILDSYLGEVPENFVFQDKTYTPFSFAEYLGIDPSNYIMLTSFTHQPYYEPIVLEIPDNWSWAESYNVPLDVLVEVVDSALVKGYSVAWAADISENGFSFKNGMAIAPKTLYAPESDKENNRWLKKTDAERESIIFDLNNPVEELTVTPELRQQAFDNFSTTDDHGMHIVGLAEDKNGKTYYYIKNSWGEDNPYKGYQFVSKPYFQYKTISIMLNRSALPLHVIHDLSL
jgi:bleomycin hydrolase